MNMSPAARGHEQQQLSLTPYPYSAIQHTEQKTHQLTLSLAARGNQPQLQLIPSSTVTQNGKKSHLVTLSSTSRDSRQHHPLVASPPAQQAGQQTLQKTLSLESRGNEQQLQLVLSPPAQRAVQQTNQATPSGQSPATRGYQPQQPQQQQQQHQQHQQQQMTPSPAALQLHASPTGAARGSMHTEFLSGSAKKRKSTADDADAASYLALLNAVLDEDQQHFSAHSAERNSAALVSNQSTSFGDGFCKGIRSFTMSRDHWENLFKSRDEFVRILCCISKCH